MAIVLGPQDGDGVEADFDETANSARDSSEEKQRHL